MHQRPVAKMRRRWLVFDVAGPPEKAVIGSIRKHLIYSDLTRLGFFGGWYCKLKSYD
jgi:hypothetical protein